MTDSHSSIYVYPAIFTPDDNGMYFIHFPDIENCITCGDDIKDGMIMAEDALALIVYTDFEETGKQAPEFTPIEKIKLKKGEFATYVMCNTKRYRKTYKKEVDTLAKGK